MTALVFLSIALVVSVVGSLALWVRNRKPTTWDSGISDFAREMKALEPREEGESQRSVDPPRGYRADDEDETPSDDQPGDPSLERR